MHTIEDAIRYLLQKKWISPEEAYDKANDKTRFAPLVKLEADDLLFA